MLEHLVEFLIGNYFGDKIAKTKNSEVRDNQQERLLVFREESPETIRQTRAIVKIESEPCGDTGRLVETQVRFPFLIFGKSK